ncbi:MAG: NUDIX hydrolase [Acidimicrobiales bacterium]
MSETSADPDHPFVKVDERLIHQGYVIGVYNVRFEGPAGEMMDRDVVRHPGAVSVVPVLDDGTVVMVRQFRSPIEEMLLEVPAGKRDVADEPPELTAHRELAEEVGYEAAEMRLLTVLVHSPGFCDERNHIFLATGLTPCDRAVEGPEEEHMTIEHVPLADAYDLVLSGVITDAKSVVGLTLAHHQLIG